MARKIFLIAGVIFILAAPVFVSAQGLKDAGKILGQVANPSQTGLSGDLATTVAAVIKAVLALVGTVFLILTIYAGILWMTAGGEEAKIEKAKGTIKASVIGLIVIMSAYAITAFVTSRLGGAAGSGSNSTGLGCCYNAATNQKVQSVQSDCDGSQEAWSPGPCT